jgi:very-short-patch-repair endonuclease
MSWGWNKGKTKQTDLRVKQIAETISKKYKGRPGHPISKSVRDRISKTLKEKHKKGEIKRWNATKGSSFAEIMFTKFLNNVGFKEQIDFFREFPFSKYFCDFYFPQKQLVVEIDGKQHEEKERQRVDQEKDAFLKSKGIKVVRIKWSAVHIQSKEMFEKIEILLKTENFEIDFKVFSDRQLNVLDKNQASIREEARQNVRKLELEEKRKVWENKLRLALSNVDCRKRGWKTKVAKILKISHTQVRRLLLKYGY